MPGLRSAAVFVFSLLLLTATTTALGQSQPDQGTDKNKTAFLVARPEIGDPVFKESVVVLFPTSLVVSEGGRHVVMGLIVNRPARISLSEFFPGDKSFKDRSETAYFGGPVDTRSFCALFRSAKDFKQSLHLFGDVQVTFDASFIAQHLKKPGEMTDLRLFLGRAQWSPDQLQNEIELGAWYNMPAETSLIFSPSPQYLWNNLLQRAAPGPIVQGPELRRALLR